MVGDLRDWAAQEISLQEHPAGLLAFGAQKFAEKVGKRSGFGLILRLAAGWQAFRQFLQRKGRFSPAPLFGRAGFIAVQGQVAGNAPEKRREKLRALRRMAFQTRR